MDTEGIAAGTSVTVLGMIGTVFLRALTEADARYGVPLERVREELGVSKALLRDASGSMALGVMTRAWVLSSELSTEPDFGLVAAETMPPGSYGELEYAVLSSPDAREALDRAVRFQRVTYAMKDHEALAAQRHLPAATVDGEVGGQHERARQRDVAVEIEEDDARRVVGARSLAKRARTVIGR